MKRYPLKLSAGLVSLAVGAGIGGCAHAQARESAGGRMVTGTQLAFELAMAQAGAAQAGAAQAVAAQTPPAAALAQPRATATIPGPDGLTEGAAYIQADQLQSTDDDGILARGNVEMRHKERIIRADQVSHNGATGVTIAEGNTRTIADDGTVQFSDRIVYDDTMSSGVSENFAAIGKDNSKVFARRVERVNEFTTRLTNIIYTPCQLCQKDGVTRAPSWSIEAGQITQRKDKKMVYYNNAVVKLRGVPVLYMPYMWTPDPELERASGFLQPDIQFTRKRGGFSYEQPYLWSISPYSYLIISPQLNASISPLVNLEYGRHFYSGEMRMRFGFTNEAFFTNDGERFGPSATRDYLLADGEFKINENWRWNFTAQHVKDPFDFVDNGGILRERDNANFFERYGIDDTYRDVGEWNAESRQLINQVHLLRQSENSYVQLSLANFQSLAVGGYYDPATNTIKPANQPTDHPLAFDSQLYPVIAPMLEAYWSPETRLLGGQLTLSANALGLQHKVYTPNGAPAYVNGLPLADRGAYDMARVSAGASWYGNMTTRGGLRWGPFFDFRHDYYQVTHLDITGREESITRDLGTVGFNFSYPLVRKFNTFTAVLEPIAQLATSPENQVNPYLPTEDSQSFEFDTTSLLQTNRSPGFDIYESGTRLNLGLRTQLNFKSGLEVQGMVGRILRDEPEAQFLRTAIYNSSTGRYTYVDGVPETPPAANQSYHPFDPSGLGRKSSDWVVDGSFNTGKGIYGYTRLRLDSETLRLAQGELGMSAFGPKTMGTLRYIFSDVLVAPVLDNNGKLVRFGENYRNLQLYARHFFTKNWGVGARLDRDLVRDEWRRSTISLIYRDDCSWYELIYQQNDTTLNRVNGKPQASIMFRLNLATLGTSGSEFRNVR